MMLGYASRVSLGVILVFLTLSSVESGLIRRSGRVARQVNGQAGGSDDIIRGMIQDIGGRQPVDLIVAMDRSKSMSKEAFYLKIKKLTRALLQQYATLDPDYVRLAAVTFAMDARVEFDYISNPDQARSKCGLFNGEDNPWGQILYEDGMAETNIKAALEHADQILQQGRQNRPGVKQVIFLITDGKYRSENDPNENAKALKDLGVLIYGAGAGVWLEIGNVRDLTSVVAGKELYADYEEWRSFARESDTPLTSYAPDTPQGWSKTDDQLCEDSCGPNAGCYCDIDRGFEQCLCMPGYHLNATGVCVECQNGTYKSEAGNADQCTPCPYGHGSPDGATAVDQCQCTNPECLDPCANNTCNSNQNCIAEDAQGFRCECKDGWEGANCDVNPDACASFSSACDGGSQCVDGLGEGVYSCVCIGWGYAGRHCEIDLDECVPGLCQNGATCTDMVNDFQCLCTSGFKGRYCQDPDEVTPSPTTPSPTPSPSGSTGEASTPQPATTPAPSTEDGDSTTDNVVSTSPGGSTGEDDMTLWIIIGASAGGGLVLLIIIIVVVVCCCRNKKKAHAQDDEKADKEVKDIARQFSGFWKRKTVRGSKWMHGEDDDEAEGGFPSVPVAHRPDLLSDTGSLGNSTENLKTDEYTEYENQTMTVKTGMESWQTYITELVDRAVIDRGIILKTKGEKAAKTGAWMYDFDEMTSLQRVMDDVRTGASVRVQDHDYYIDKNDGALASGSVMPDGSPRDRIIVVGSTRSYLIVFTAFADNDDGNARKEVQWIVDHIAGEGY